MLLQVPRPPQKNFDLPPELLQQWSAFCDRVLAKQKSAGAVALFVASRFTGRQWAQAVDDYNEWLATKRGAGGDAPTNETMLGKRQGRGDGTGKPKRSSAA